MIKRKNSENLIVRESIFVALMQLMETQAINDISITDITTRAGVSRMAYYRNYKDKNDILQSYMDDLFNDYWNQIHSKPSDDFQSACLYFEYFRQNKVFIMNLVRAELYKLILDSHEVYLRTIFKDLYQHLSFNSIEEKYIIDFLTGGLFKILLAWTKNDMVDSNETMAKITCALMKI